MKCTRCGSHAINPRAHGRDPARHTDLCDVCYWRRKAEFYIKHLKDLHGLTPAWALYEEGDQ